MMTKMLSGWGRYPVRAAEVHGPRTASELAAVLAAGDTALARGLGRSYGDAAVAARVADMRGADTLFAFDRRHGVIECAAGVSLDELVAVTLPAGWFPAVTPGTAQVTVGGAIASDVHGKNHHRDGAFSDHLEWFDLMTADGATLRCSRTDNAALFAATAGGMGLTGVITRACLRLTRVPGAMIDERVTRTASLDDTMARLRAGESARYAVAWIDALAAGPACGRGIVMLGEHAPGDGVTAGRATPGVPLTPPLNLVRRAPLCLFNAASWRRPRAQSHRVPCRRYFYPLDRLGAWHRLYGPGGFLQHQSVVPFDDAGRVLADMLHTLGTSPTFAALAVLKTLGAANDNLLSFPRAGFTLALDLPLSGAAFAVMATLDDIVAAAGGRVYLAKDATLSAANFRRMYPHWEQFQSVREAHGARGRFVSHLSTRLALD